MSKEDASKNESLCKTLLLEKYNGIWDKASNNIKKELDCKSIYKK